MKSYANLTDAYGIKSNEAGRIALGLAPLYFVRPGYYHVNGNMYNLGSYGYYWSSTVFNTTRAYGLLFYGSDVLPQGNYYLDRGYGYSLRCVAR